jgi:hypothetical protein
VNESEGRLYNILRERKDDSVELAGRAGIVEGRR